MARGDTSLVYLWEPSWDADIKAFTASVARGVLAEEQAAGFDDDPITIVDGSYGGNPDDVKAFGRIEFAARVTLGEAAEWIWSEIWRRSPVESGQFQDSNIVMINGTSVDDLKGLKPGDRVQFTNTQPYAGKIERGESLMAPNGVYRAVAAAARSRFKGVFVDFNWIKLDTGVRAATMSRQGVAGTRAVQFPSISLFQSADNAAAGDE